MTRRRGRPLFEPAIVRRAVLDAFLKLDPRIQVRNPVMFVVVVTALLTTVLGILALRGNGEASPGFIVAVAAGLWFTVLFANFAEAMAEGRGKAQAASLRKARRDHGNLERAAAARPHRSRHGRRVHPERRRDRGRHRVGRRERDHR